MRIKRMFIAILLISVSSMLSAQLTYGTTGLLHAPSAEMQKPPESGRAPGRSPRPDRTEPGRRPLRRRSTAHPTGIPAELYGGCPMEGRGRVPEKVVEDHPAGRLSRQLYPYPGYAQRVGAAAPAKASLLVELLNADHYLYGPATGLDLLPPQEPEAQ